ncbi:SGNH/GDSL hydrolase family protein [Salimicrobium halophilum]|uniref:Lysophospholipase L1 n=1 Tax=Salimicrobium halophilum TaxID=86666 RepID=A0A1G8SVS1_9BACI|nr:SGNH/GDSL hydrolase family protein [Salimicrobium halophilum]SDJ33274.1 Lysophospholipase L1 [Salimicrobium halophilum]
MIKKWTIMIIVLLATLSGLFLLFGTPLSEEEPSSPQVSPPAEPEEETATSPPENETDTEEEPEEDASLSEDIRDAFSSVLESARTLFIRNDLNITAMGDSLTQGVGDGTEKGGYIGILEESINQNTETAAERVQIDNFGKRGNRTDQLLKRMEQEEIKESIEQADLVLITIGANDVMKVVKDNVASLDYQQFVEAQSDYEANLRKIFTKTRELNPDADIYMLGVYNPFNQYFNHIPELNQIMSDWNRISKQVMTEFTNISFIPIRDIFESTEEDLLWEDNFHPNELGYKRIAERVLEYIRDDIEEQ